MPAPVATLTGDDGRQIATTDPHVILILQWALQGATRTAVMGSGVKKAATVPVDATPALPSATV